MTAGIFLIIPLFFLFSVKVEKNKVITISKPIVITQARKTPAFYLYQQANNLDKQEEIAAPVTTTFLSTEKAEIIAPPVQLTEMKFDQAEIGTGVDYGFRIAQTQNRQIQNVAPAVQEIQRNESLAATKTVLVQPNQSPLKKWATVRGKFEVRGGVGVVDHIVEITRVEEGQVREVGQIDLKAGLYSIDIESPQGELVAKIKDQNGVLIGRDQQKVINLQSRGQYFEGPFIRVGPTQGIATNPAIPSAGSSGSSGQTIAGMGAGIGGSRSGDRGSVTRSAVNLKSKDDASGISVSLFSEQNQLEKPKDQFTNVSQNSSTISLITDKNNVYTNIVSIRQTDDASETPLFTKKWVDGVLSYVSDQMKIEFKSKDAPIIIGRVFSDQKTTAGMKVQIESQPGLNPIYLDQFMIPNMKQDETSENGYFMFVGLEAEDYSVVAFQNNKIVGHQMFATDVGSIAYQNILTNTAPRSVLVRSFDAFTGQPIDADIISSDLEDVIETQAGLSSFRTNNSLGISNYVVRTKQNYMPINYIQDSRLNHVHIPMISEEWLSKIQEKLEMNSLPNTGTVIGFVPGLVEYDMYLIAEDYNAQQSIYFDQYGQISKQPVPGGGFILFNVPAGAREVVVQEKKSERIYSQVHLVKSSQTSVSHFSE